MSATPPTSSEVPESNPATSPSADPDLPASPDADTGPRPGLPDWLWIPAMSVAIAGLMAWVGWSAFAG